MSDAATAEALSPLTSSCRGCGGPGGGVGKRLTTAANPDRIISGYFSSYSINKGMLTTLPPPPCPPRPQVIFPKSHAKGLSHRCVHCWCLSQLGVLLLFPY